MKNKLYIVVLLFFITRCLFASPTDIGDTGTYQKPSAPTLPAAGGTFTDPVFLTTIMRATDRTDGDLNVHPYSSDGSSFNCDSTRFVLNLDNTITLYSINPTNFTITKEGNLFAAITLDWAFLQWHSSDPDVLFGLENQGKKLYEYNVDTQAYTLTKDFNSDLSAEFAALAAATGGDEWLSYLTKGVNDRWFAFIVGNEDGGAGNENNLGVFGAYDKQTDTTYTYDLDAGFGYKYLHAGLIDKSGVYVYFGTNDTTTPANTKWVWNIVAGTVVELQDTSAIRSHGHRAMGTTTEYNVDGSVDRLAIVKRTLTSPTSITLILKPASEDFDTVGHYSLNHSDESFLVVSNYFASDITTHTLPWQSEIFYAFTADVETTRTKRLAHHRSEPYAGGGASTYWSQPHASTSLDGRFIIFTSNWDGSAYVDVFILEVPTGVTSIFKEFTGLSYQ